jgi:hypothetical protein
VSELPSLAAWDALRAAIVGLDAELRQRIAGEWTRDAQFEHASIASFGRFALELLAVGAPAELIERAHRAAIDEVGHARLCFGLASLYAGMALGPGPLPLDSSAFSSAPDLAGIAHATVLEGCVNETLAAIEAQTARTLAEPEAVRDALRLIESQESEHASLAFAFVSWASSSGGPKVRDAVRSAFVLAGEQIRMAPSPLAGEQDAMLARHGRLPEAQRVELRKRAFVELIVPAARELVARDQWLASPG